MAQVVRTRQAAHVDYLLDYLFRHWQGLADVAREWETWDPVDQEVFRLEWTVKDERLAEVEEHAGHGYLTPAQYARYEALLKLVEENRPVLARLLAD